MVDVNLRIPNLDQEMDILADTTWVDARRRRLMTPRLEDGRIHFEERALEPFSPLPGHPERPVSELFLCNEQRHFMLRRIGSVNLYTPSFAGWRGPSLQIEPEIIADLIDIYQGLVGLSTYDSLFKEKAYARFFTDLLAAWHSDELQVKVNGSLYQGLSLLYELGIIAALDATPGDLDPNSPIPLVMLKLDGAIQGHERQHYKELLIGLFGHALIHEEAWVPAFSTRKGRA